MMKLIQYGLMGILIGGILGCQKPEEKKKESVSDRSSFAFPKPEYRKAALANVELGLGYLSQGQVVRAKSKLTKAVKLAPNIPETHSAMSYFLEMTGEYAEAEQQHKKALRVSNSAGAVYNNYGAFLCRRGRFAEADRAFQQALEDKDYARTAEVYENAGLCAMRSVNVEKARSYFTVAIQRDPSRARALLELADLSIQEKEYAQARQFLNRYRNLSEPTPRSLSLSIQVAKAMQDTNREASDVLLLKSLFEDSPEYQHYLQGAKS